MQGGKRNNRNIDEYQSKSLQKATNDTKRQNKIINNSITDSCTTIT